MSSDTHCRPESIHYKLMVSCCRCPCLDDASVAQEDGHFLVMLTHALVSCHVNQEGSSCVSLFESEGKPWKATEELALLEAVELYGFGNWEDTAKLVGTRTSAEVKNHFITFYVHGNIGRVCWSQASRGTYQVVDHTCSAGSSSSTRPPSALSPSLTTPLQAIPDLPLLQQQHLGYMPRRDDFEREFDNEVETLISTLRINPHDEDDLDVDLKVAHIDMYNRRLRERFRKKTVVRDYALVSQFYKSLENDEEIMALLDPALYPHLQSYSQSRQPSSSLPNSSLRTNQTSRLQSVSSSVTSPASPSRASSSTASTPLSSPVQSNSSRCRNPSSPNKVTSVLSPVSSCPSPSSLSNGKARKNKKDEVQEIVCLVKSSSVSEKFKEGLREKFKIFSQFQSAMNQEQVLDSLKREKDLKMKIKELIRCRKNGLKKLSDIPAFDAVRAKRGKKKENKKKVCNFASNFNLIFSCVCCYEMPCLIYHFFRFCRSHLVTRFC